MEVEIENFFVNQKEMSIFNHGRDYLYLQSYKRCTVKTINEMQNPPKKPQKSRKGKGKQDSSSSSSIPVDSVDGAEQYFKSCLDDTSTNVAIQNFNEEERKKMHLNKLNELLNNEEFKQFLQCEAYGN
ncbi:unnamed protein product [Meloidogyne enterolobii]|uniref:Uncharacterized protein n=1 Tax=Meloidogyne enterolobii TaxID=390850 RepID=A0ACB1A721_MELEN